MVKLEKLRKSFSANNLDAILITSPINRRYISGFTGSAGAVIVTDSEAIFITDFRYTEQAEAQAQGYKIIEHKKSIDEEINAVLKDLNVKRLGFEKDYTTYSQFEKYKNNFDVELVATSGIIEELRIIKTNEELEIMKKAAKIADDAFIHIDQGQTYLSASSLDRQSIANYIEKNN